MLLSFENGIENMDGFDCYMQNGSAYYFSGIIWMRGRKAGQDTARQIAAACDETGDVPFAAIFGSFCFVIRKPSGELILFTDNSNFLFFSINCTK